MTIRRLIETYAIRREARRRLRILDAQGRGPWIRVGLALQRDEWPDAKGLTSATEIVPLNRDGLRLTVRRWAAIRRSCLQGLEAEVRRERSGGALRWLRKRP